MTPFFYCFREREQILDLFEEYCGARLTLNCMRIGGLPYDLHGRLDRASAASSSTTFPARIDEYEELLDRQPHLEEAHRRRRRAARPRMAIDYGITGPMLRGSGVDWDLRKAPSLRGYDELEFDVPTRKNGDTYDRYLVRMEEMRQSNAHHPAVPGQAARAGR